MKHCNKCGTGKPKTEFNKNSRKSDGLQTWCRECTKIENNRNYLTNEKRRAKIRERNKEESRSNRDFYRRYRRFCGCKVCGERESVCLDLHHLDPTKKDAAPNVFTTHSRKRLKAEIRKCVVLCSNCHRKVHAKLIELDP
jgi:hypothetical protein